MRKVFEKKGNGDVVVLCMDPEIPDLPKEQLAVLHKFKNAVLVAYNGMVKESHDKKFPDNYPEIVTALSSVMFADNLQQMIESRLPGKDINNIMTRRAAMDLLLAADYLVRREIRYKKPAEP
jgi:hypothetical protein